VRPETDNTGTTDRRVFTYGNSIDEVVVVFDWTAPAVGEGPDG
jgi:hypothetical protein